MARSGTTKSQDELASSLNELCQGAVQAAGSPQRNREAFLGHLLAQVRDLREAGSEAEPIADFLDALAEILSGRSLEAAIVGLVDPFRQGLRAVALDIEAAQQGQAQRTGETATEDEDGDEADTAEEDPEDWVAALAAQTVTLLRERDRESAATLVTDLSKIRSQGGIDPDASAYLEVLEGVLSGGDVRASALRLAQPYRDAYFSLQKLMMGADPRKELLQRVEHNASLVMRAGGPEARLGLGDVLGDLQARAEARDAGELATFVEAVGGLVDADSEFSGQDTRFEDEELQAAWLRIREAWSTPPLQGSAKD